MKEIRDIEQNFKNSGKIAKNNEKMTSLLNGPKYKFQQNYYHILKFDNNHKQINQIFFLRHCYRKVQSTRQKN